LWIGLSTLTTLTAAIFFCSMLKDLISSERSVSDWKVTMYLFGSMFAARMCFTFGSTVKTAWIEIFSVAGSSCVKVPESCCLSFSNDFWMNSVKSSIRIRRITFSFFTIR